MPSCHFDSSKCQSHGPRKMELTKSQYWDWDAYKNMNFTSHFNAFQAFCWRVTVRSHTESYWVILSYCSHCSLPPLRITTSLAPAAQKSYISRPGSVCLIGMHVHPPILSSPRKNTNLEHLSRVATLGTQQMKHRLLFTGSSFVSRLSCGFQHKSSQAWGIQLKLP